MKLFVRGLLTSGLLLAGLMLTGCASSFDDPFLTSEKSAPTMAADSTTAAEREAADVAHFHVGETIKIVFSGTTDQIPEHDEPIKEDGTITLPLIGSVKADGKTAGELQNEIHDLYVPKYYVRLNVTVSPGDLVYYVSGEVKQPGRQLYLGETTVTKAITSAGDFTDFANHSKVWLIRSNGQRIKVNVDKALEDPSKDPRVYPGDQIDVPRRIF
ncbi:MAG: polysaccharide biosynthesis/export family protein [Limisphaerales bacterium]